ncbi:MAG: acyl-CoA thioester hydrolase [Alphaproteobacteria bacterium]|nr:MAG: acyl-CoA thioester hydrolase [Alphaproteobacteria bacterium]
MRWKNGLAITAIVAVLVGGAAMFKLLAPENYGLPQIEVLEPGPTGVRVEEAGVFGNFYPAAGDGPHPGIVSLGGSEGGLGRGVKHMALELQREGFSVLQLAYFGAPGTSESLERIPLELFDRGLAWLGAQPGVDAQRLALVGGSKGAEAVLLVATRHPELRAVVAGMPTNVAWNGINWQRGGQSESSSWTSGGEDIPTMPFSSWNQAEGVISVYRSIEDSAQRAAAERAAIPIERARAEMLLVCGEAETMWPACPMSRAVAARAAERGGPQIHILAYADAGHLVFGPPIARDNAFYQRLDMLGGTVEGNAAARADSWPRIVAFLRETTMPRPLPAN